LFGPEAGIVVMRMFDERKIDPTAPEFDKQMFLEGSPKLDERLITQRA